MTLIECPSCSREVDIDLRNVMKWEDGLDLIVKCPNCGERFIIGRISEVRKQLNKAEYGFKLNKKNKKVKVKL